ncbi:LysR family transcriptional regulator [Granulosicoccus sp. 3-233]|uniref:LysR family transcriptional regulator n=1 Tax=Granulosicoccus sp. 3-233 TaxID=3417969 RepID=UPI003D340A38
MMKLEMLRVFRIVAEKGSLAAAADALHRTPAAISMTLAQLTESIGAPLFETDRKNRLTPLGRLVLQECHRATDTFDRCTDAIQRHVRATAGTVRIAAVPSAAVSLLPLAIASFRRDHADVRLEISDVDSAAVRRRIHTDDADIGIISATPSDTRKEDVILTDRLGIVHAGNGAIAEALRDPDVRPGWHLLSLEPLIANPLCDMIDHPQVASHLARCTLQARSTTALLTFVQNGLGTTVLPSNAITSGMVNVAFVQPDDPPAYRELRKIRHEEKRLSPVAEAFWNALSA